MQIALLTIASIVSLLFLITFAAQRLLYSNSTIVEVGGYPWVTVLAQLLAYVVVLLFMVSIVKRKGGQFLQAIRWNRPQNSSAYLFGGVILAVLVGVAVSIFWRRVKGNSSPASEFVSIRAIDRKQ